MQVQELKETENSEENPGEKSEKDDEKKGSDEESAEKGDDFGSILDVSAKSFDFPVLDGVEESVEALYMYKNVFNLIPRAVGNLKYLKTLKFFANELNLFPGEFNDMDGLECLQVKVAAAPGLSGLDLGKLKALKELELSRVPLRSSAFPILSGLAGLKCLTKLSVCHFSIRFLPPEIGRLNNLEYLDLSFNKMKNLPTEITFLNSLISLKIANNKLVELPSGLSSLQKLENLDLSNNRLTSLGFLELESMHNLQRLNLQYNKLLSCCQVPSWICCNLEGNGKDLSNDEFSSSSAEMDVVEYVVEEACKSNSRGSSMTSLNHSSGSSPSNKCFAARKSKGWKRRYSLQQRARQERLNSSRKWKGQNHAVIQKATEQCLTCRDSVLPDDSLAEKSFTTLVPEVDGKELFSGGVEFRNLITSVDNNKIALEKDYCERKCSCDAPESLQHHREIESACTKHKTASNSLPNANSIPNDCSYSEVSSSIPKSKRHSDAELDNPKPRKYGRSSGNESETSSQYSRMSFCGVDDYLSDGFYDAGRDRPFMTLSLYEKNLQLDSREVILVDRERDEKLDVIVLCAQALVSRFRQMNDSMKERGHGATDSLQIASLLAIFVSDHFGGSDKSAVIQKTRKAVSGSNYRKPFVCTCPTGNDDSIKRTTKDSLDGTEDIVFVDLCERALQSIKTRLNSVVVPIGSLQFGVCRHRALLMKYLCDRVEPPIPCELVRGFLDFSAHAWNVIAVKRDRSWVRMIVDACHPHDIREETDPEYFCRYMPLSRMTVSVWGDGKGCSFPSLSACDHIGKTASTTLLQCKIGSLEVAAKVHKLEACGMSADEIRSFELNSLGEARMLGSLKHPCIVNFYGYQISSKWASSSDGKSDIRILQSAILMEYIKGGSLKLYLEKLARAGDKRVPVVLALFIARDVACALAELHSRHIIHRDIKSENILIDLEEKRDDGSPIVKLCDFDRAIPLRSSLHSCCIAHTGIPPPDVCVGTPRWMAPEVFRTMDRRDMYGLEVDIWSFGCLLLELLTLRIPYADLPETDTHSFLEIGKRPHLTEELEEFTDSDREWEDLVMVQLDAELKGLENESKILKILVALYYWCTENNAKDRPTSKKLYKLLAHASSIVGSKSIEQE